MLYRCLGGGTPNVAFGLLLCYIEIVEVVGSVGPLASLDLT